MQMYEITKQVIDLRGIHLQGNILDIGGGGEGVISCHSGSRVVAIDKRRDELAESPEIGLKIVMDACELGFMDNSFDNVTFFYTLMYMGEGELTKALEEAYRVLKPGGRLYAWDAVMPPNPSADILLVPLEVVVSNELTLTPTYGISWTRGQAADDICVLCQNAGLMLES